MGRSLYMILIQVLVLQKDIVLVQFGDGVTIIDMDGLL